MKKVLFVWNWLKIGGSETALIRLTKYLQDYYDISILCHENIVEYDVSSKVNIYNVQQTKIKCVFIRKILEKTYLIKGIWIRSRNISTIVTYEVPIIAICCYMIARLKGKKIIIWNHSCRDELILTTNYILEIIYKYVLRRADLIVNVSKYAEDSLFRYLNLTHMSNSTVIYNIIEPVEDLEFVNGANNKIFSIVAVGSLVAEKNFPLLIKAVHELDLNHGVKVMLTIYGEGSEKIKLTSIIQELQLDGRIFLAGRVKNPEKYMRNSDLVISVSNSESFSLVVCEAMIAKKPIIATNTGAAEVLDNGRYGIVIQRGNLMQLVNAILQIMRYPDDAKIKINQYDKALLRFDPKDILPKWINYL